jgi:hypothetical protein
MQISGKKIYRKMEEKVWKNVETWNELEAEFNEERKQMLAELEKKND